MALLRVGVLGASRIVKKALLDEAPGHVLVEAIAARDLGRARVFAALYGIGRAFGSYEELLADPELDAVYIALPASAHAEWSIRALKAKKHVLCEKPFGLHVDEASEAVAVARQEGRILMEAHHWRYHPLIAATEDALSRLESPQRIEAVFNGGLNSPGDIRLNPALGPGVLMDFGCYLVQWCEWMASCISGGARSLSTQLSGSDVWDPPQVVRARITESAPGIDLAAEVELKFGALTAHLRCDMRDGVPFENYVRATGANGSVHFQGPLIAQGSELRASWGGRPTQVTRAEGPTTYSAQLAAFVSAIASGSPPPTAGASIIGTQATIDAIYEAAGCISRRDLRARALGAGLATEAESAARID